jgi:hypothetical protein
MQRPIRGHEGDDLPDIAALAAPQAGDQAGAHHRRLAAAGCTDDGHQRLAGERRCERIGERGAAEEERLVLLAEGAQAAVGANLGAEGFDPLQDERPRRLPTNGCAQCLQRSIVRDPRRQIDPGVELEEAQGGIGAGEQHRDHREARLPPLPIEC